MPDLRGMTVVVTDAGGGIGRAACVRLAQDGADIAALDIDEDAAHETASAVRNTGVRGVALPCDVGDEDSVRAAVEATVDQLGPVSGLFANAAIADSGPLHELPLEGWERVLRVDLTGVFLSIKHCLPSMLAAGRGSIVTVGSLASVVAVKGGGAASYKAAKGGVTMLTKTVAVEYAESGIRANCLCPGAVETGFGSTAGAPRPGVVTAPLARRAVPEEVASVLSFLLSAVAGYVTGTTIMVDGGYTAI